MGSHASLATSCGQRLNHPRDGGLCGATYAPGRWEGDDIMTQDTLRYYSAFTLAGERYTVGDYVYLASAQV